MPLARYFALQPRRQVSAWLSHEVRQGVLNVAGHARLHEAAWVEQFAEQASEAESATRIFGVWANATPVRTKKSAPQRIIFIE